MSTAMASPELFVQESIAKISHIATLPEITSKIISIVQNPASTAAQLHSIVSNDPALATRILKTVNSAFYGLPGQIGSLERAIVLLGLNAVKNIAVAASLGQMFRNVTLCEGYSARDLWTHCIGVGLAAREMAKRMKLALTEEAFLAGLIHDAGILVWLQAHPDTFMSICDRQKQTQGDFCQIEREISGVDHQMLGMALAESWRFPRSCQLAAGYHHRPTALAQDHRLLVSLVFLADTICCQQNFGFNLTARHQTTADANLEQFGINQGMIDSVVQAMPELMKSGGSLFD